jgi:hypothetical protein
MTRSAKSPLQTKTTVSRLGLKADKFNLHARGLCFAMDKHMVQNNSYDLEPVSADGYVF